MIIHCVSLLHLWASLDPYCKLETDTSHTHNIIQKCEDDLIEKDEANFILNNLNACVPLTTQTSAAHEEALSSLC